jgi:hypothetical protein
MQKSEIDLRTVKRAVNAVLDHLIEDLRLESVPIRDGEDLYWDCGAPEAYDVSKTPPDLTVGKLSDDIHFIQSVHRGESADFAYNLVHVAPLLRYIGETVKK